jgi:hypothetical protein
LECMPGGQLKCGRYLFAAVRHMSRAPRQPISETMHFTLFHRQGWWVPGHVHTSNSKSSWTKGCSLWQLTLWTLAIFTNFTIFENLVKFHQWV